ncbi:MAG: hypothetical protein KQH53_08285 [Desulfarculaceae bacterium]|nr:hypothetical protein [Desulfarculaceae bacterium]
MSDELALFTGAPVNTLNEDGSMVEGVQLGDGLVLTKHEAHMEPVGEHDGKKVWHWLVKGAHLDALKQRPDYLGAKYEDLPSEVADQVMEVAIPAEIQDPSGGKVMGTRRVKVAEAKALGLDLMGKEILEPHQWAGRE